MFGPSGPGGMVRALTYNIHSGMGRDGAYAPERNLRVIDAASADIVGLQEVDARLGSGPRYDQFEFFAERAGMYCIAGPNIVEQRGRYGNALLSRLPVEASRLIKLPVGATEPRGAICAVLRCGGRRLQVIVTHLGLRQAERSAQVRVLLAEAAGHEGPTLFMGDFNAWYRQLTTLRVLGAPTGRTLAPRTYPALRPIFALDRIWTRPLWLLQSVRVIRDELTLVASDHLPLLASLNIPNGK